MTDQLTSPEVLFNKGIKAHHKKKWEDAKDKYNAALVSKPNSKLENKILQYIALVESELRPPGKSGYVAMAVVILTVVIVLSVGYTYTRTIMLPMIGLVVGDFDVEEILGLTLFLGLIVAVIVAIRSFFQRGLSNRLAGAASIVLAILILLVTWPPDHPFDPTRTKISEGILLGGEAKIPISENYIINQRLPNSNFEAGLKDPVHYSSENVRSVTVGKGGRITIEYKGDRIEGLTIIFKPILYSDGAIGWDCKGGTIPDEVRPLGCQAEKLY